MKKSIFAIMVLLFFIGCSKTPENTLTQVSTIDALLAGAYDGILTCSELSDYGDFGIGTFDRLDGEMIMKDGRIYQVRSDGTIAMPSGEVKVPFASVSHFNPDTTFVVRGETDFKCMEEIINRSTPDMNRFYSIQIRGTFESMKTRSVPPQVKPFPPLVEVIKEQPVFEMTHVTGMIVGFRCPAFLKGVNVPGYHLHFICDSLNRGGHILAFKTDSVEIDLDALNRFVLILPDEESGFAKIDLGRDREGELERVEK
jgi:acetolactate decarboxylase